MSEKLKEILSVVNAHPGTTLVAVSKTVGLPEIERAFAYGISNFGENRVQEALEKINLCNLPVDWHFVGNMQTNKLRKVLSKFVLIHSLSSRHLADEASRVANATGKTFSFLVQVDTTDEPTKQGLRLTEVEAFMDYVVKLPNIVVQGLMTMGPNTSNQEAIRQSFRQVRELYEYLSKKSSPSLEMRYLSMGMSGDYRLALAEGSNMVRIGTAIFTNIN